MKKNIDIYFTIYNDIDSFFMWSKKRNKRKNTS